MADEQNQTPKPKRDTILPERLMRRVLEGVGDVVDRRLGRTAEPDGQEAIRLQPGHHHIVPGLPLLDPLVGEIGGIVDHRLEDRRQVDGDRVAVRQVVLFLVEEPQELEGLVRILRLGEDGRDLIADLRDEEDDSGSLAAAATERLLEHHVRPAERRRSPEEVGRDARIALQRVGLEDPLERPDRLAAAAERYRRLSELLPVCRLIDAAGDRASIASHVYATLWGGRDTNSRNANVKHTD